MSIISRKNKNKTKVRSEPQTQTSTLAYWLQHDDILCPTGYKPLSKNEEVIQCANIIADLVSSMTIMLMQNGENGDTRLKNELARKMDVNPNKFMVRKNFIYKIVKDMLLTGNSVARPSYKEGYLDNITLLKASSTSFYQVGEEYRILYNATSFASDEVLHFVLVPDEDEPFRGVGYKSAIFETVKNLLQANATKTGFLKSKWKPSMIISINSDIEELQDKEKRKKIVGSYTDTTEAGEPWLIPTGEIDVKTIQPLTLNDLAIQDSITLDKRTIAAAFQIPPFMVGVGNFNKDEYNNFVSTKIMSIAMILQQELTKKLLYSNDKYFKFNPKSLMQYNLSEKTAFVKEMVGGGMMNRNEGRNEFDYSPVDNEGMNEFNVLENYIPVSDVGKQKKLIKEGKEDE